MSCFSHEEEKQSLCSMPSLIREACSYCHISSCLKSSSSLSFEDEGGGEDTLSDSDIDNKHVIILEIRSRAMKAKAKPKDYLFSDNLHWFIAPNETKEKGDNNDGDVQSEVFYSVKSCFSRCSSEKENDILSHFRRRNSIWEEFLHCEGWPFGLSRKALMLPPLPRSPPDSWTWSKRNTGTKFCAAT